MLKQSVALVSVLALPACATFPPPNETLANSLASVRGAEELGAADVPKAALQLQLAREEITEARALMANGENELANSMAQRAINDAELAIVMVHEHQARVNSAAAKQRVQSAKTSKETQ